MDDNTARIILGFPAIIIGLLMIRFNKNLAEIHLKGQNNLYKLGVTDIGLPIMRAGLIIGGIATVIMGTIITFSIGIF